MKVLKQQHGVSLVEVVASIVLITIILISFSTVFLQSKKTHVLSESVVDATYVAQQEMEEIYGMVSRKDDPFSRNSATWLRAPTTRQISLKGDTTPNPKIFKYDVDTIDPDCTGDCKKFVLIDNKEHWIKLKNITGDENIPDNVLVNVIVNVPKENSSTPVMMESIFRWGN